METRLGPWQKLLNKETSEPVTTMMRNLVYVCDCVVIRPISSNYFFKQWRAWSWQHKGLIPLILHPVPLFSFLFFLFFINQFFALFFILYTKQGKRSKIIKKPNAMWKESFEQLWVLSCYTLSLMCVCGSRARRNSLVHFTIRNSRME